MMVLERYPEIDYAIIYRPENKLTPFVAAMTEERYVVTYNYQCDPELHGVYDTEEKAKAHIADIGGEYTEKWNCPWKITRMLANEPPVDPVWI